MTTVFRVGFAPEPAKDVTYSMPTEPVPLTLAILEICLLLTGAGFWLGLGTNPDRRTRWFSPHRLPPWPVSGSEFILLVGLIFFLGFVSQALVRISFGNAILQATDRDGLQIFLYGLALDGGGLAAWFLFPMLRRYWSADFGAVAPPLLPVKQSLPPPWPKVGRQAVVTLLLAFPLVALLSLGWTAVLRAFGLPDEPQSLIGIFANTRSPLVIGGMLVLACVVAPLYEELLFRAGLYRFCRQRLGRNSALLISGALFGALHGNLAGFLPLTVFGMILALAYETTGYLRVAVIAHGLFNLNSIMVVLSGLAEQAR